ncbi:MAG: tRNA uracil 4-sulfurtransferase ThiI [Acidobacteriota bacterium]
MGEPYHFVINFAGELGVKGRDIRNRFIARLAGNLTDAMKSAGHPFEIERRWSRLFLISPNEAAGATAARVFGVRSVAKAVRRPWTDLEDLVATGGKVLRSAVRGRTFAVRVRRGDRANQLPFRSPEVERRIGALLAPHSAGVSLKTPEVEARVELHDGSAYFFAERVDGPGGLPLGSGGRALALVSGGFDSAVAAWLTLRRGVRLEYLFFDLGGESHRMGSLEVLKILADRWSYGHRPRLRVVDLRPVAKQIRERCPEGLWQVVLKRVMVRLACRLAEATDSAALVTGEAIGQVSSQTLENLRAIEAAADLPVLRPLVTCPKEEILDLARRIGTYEASSRVREYCGLGGSGPETDVPTDRADSAEAALEPALLSRLMEEGAELDLRTLELRGGSAPDLRVGAIDDAAQAVDLRSEGAYRSWHYPGAIRMGYAEALDAAGDLDRGRRYVFYCELGLKSAHVAEVLGRAGVDARYYAGGLRRLVRWAESTVDPALSAALSPALLE